MNGGAPERLGDGAVRSALDELAAELAVVAHRQRAPPAEPARPPWLAAPARAQVTVETIGSSRWR